MIEPIKVIGQILQAELGLEEGRILLENQPLPAPNDTDLFIRLRYESPSEVVGVGTETADNPAGLREEQGATYRHVICISIMSFGAKARLRKEEVALALTSQTAEQLAEENQIQIARTVGPILNLSEAEAGSMLNRYTIDVPVFAVHRKEKQVDYFTDFTNIPEVQNA